MLPKFLKSWDKKFDLLYFLINFVFEYKYPGTKEILEFSLNKKFIPSINIPLSLDQEIHLPSIFSIEEIFYSNNVKSSLLLGHARGVAIAAAATNDIIVYEYSAKKIKQSLTGNGNAHKEQVKFMVKN
mgnify:CR=1 FL=1